jgi:hypothetical protein
MRAVSRILLTGLVAVAFLPAQNGSSETGRIRGYSGDMSGYYNMNGTFVILRLWQGDGHGRQGTVNLSYFVTLCAPYYSCPEYASGSGPIPASALQSDKDKLVLSVDISTLSSEFQRTGVEGRIDLVWDKSVALYQERITGTQRIVEGPITTHLNGTLTRWISPEIRGTVLGFAFPSGQPGAYPPYGSLEFANNTQITVERK